MEKAKERVQELLNETPDASMDGLKPDINNLLHMYLPDDTTIKQGGIISMVIFEMITNPDYFLSKT